MAAGQKKLDPSFADASDPRKKTGLATNGMYARIDYDPNRIYRSRPRS